MLWPLQVSGCSRAGQQPVEDQVNAIDKAIQLTRSHSAFLNFESSSSSRFTSERLVLWVAANSSSSHASRRTVLPYLVRESSSGHVLRKKMSSVTLRIAPWMTSWTTVGCFLSKMCFAPGVWTNGANVDQTVAPSSELSSTLYADLAFFEDLVFFKLSTSSVSGAGEVGVLTTGHWQISTLWMKENEMHTSAEKASARRR